MTIFWLAIIVITLIAISFLVVPLLLCSLDKRSASRELEATIHAPTQRINPSYRYATILVLVISLPLLSITLYLKLGASEQVAEQQQTAEKNKTIDTEIKKLGSLQNIILTLKQKVMANPDSQGWSLLGRLYLKNQQFKEASDAFAQANQLAPHQPDILVAYAESLYFANQLVLTPKAKRLLEQALQLQPAQPNAINLLGMDAYQRGDYAVAVTQWEQLLPQLQQGSEEQQKLLQMIAEAQKKAKPAATASNIKLAVDVTLATSLKQQLTGHETVFIYAQAVKGPSIPLAIVRKQVDDLPLAVILDQTTSMLPTATLADYQRVKIIARISKSGQAMPATGDLIGTSLPIDTQHPPAKIKIVIDSRLSNVKAI